MSQLFRLLCVCLSVTIVVALQAHSAVTAQHRVEHGLQFPSVSYADASEIDHDHDHDHAASSPISDSATMDVADADAETGPVNHHHHGGDIHLALATPLHPFDAGFPGSASLGLVPDAVPPGLSQDGPSHPPKQLRA